MVWHFTMQTVAIIVIIDKRGIFLVSFYSMGGVGGRVLGYLYGAKHDSLI